MFQRLALHFNDFFAVVLVVAVFSFWAALPRLGLNQEQGSLIIGAGIVWVGNIVQHYYRKAQGEDAAK